MNQAASEKAAPRSEEAQQLRVLVEKAAALLERKGKGAFPEFRRKGSEWYTDATYIFVDNMQGTALVNPPQTQIEGENFIDMKDVTGKAVMREMIAIVQTQDTGWVEYQWPRPGETQPARKVNYIKKVTVNGETLIIGAGLYLNEGKEGRQK